MPNGRPYDSPLNKLADALPTFIMQVQEMKMRQEAQEALNQYRWAALAEQEEARKALDAVRREMGYYEPPEVKMLRDNISQELRILNDPDNDPGNEFATHPLEDKNIKRRWEKVQNMQADYSGRTGRDISVSVPISVEGVLGRVEDAKPPLAAAPPGVVETPAEISRRRAEELAKKKIAEPIRKAEIEAEKLKVLRFQPWGVGVAAGEIAAPTVPPAVVEPAVEIPPEFPNPSGFPEGQPATFNGEPWIIRNGQWMKVK